MKTPAVIRDICGTWQGYGKHRRMNEEKCQPCKDAEANRSREGREKRRPEPRPGADEIAQEIDWQLSCGQGWGQAMRAVGYTNPITLARRLQRNGRLDLANIFESPDREAA
jgi:hypothetical protein